MNIMTKAILTMAMVLAIAGCETSDSTLRQEGRSAAYIQGFHDGRHSGMKEEGNDFEHYLKDEARFSNESDYKQGWLAGETEGKKLQAQATSIGNTAAGAYSDSQISKEAKKNTDADAIAKDAVEGVDTSDLDKL